MEVSCPACAARYTADDEKLRGKTARMRCKACNTVWLVSGSGASSAPAAMGHAPIEHESSSKRAAVVRRGAEREKRDLFAARETDYGSVKQTLPPAPSFGFTGGGVGARNENSVLFRVDQLLGPGRVSTAEPTRSPAMASQSGPLPHNGDDEGVIDLNALASVPPRGVGMPIAPLFSEPPGVAVDVHDAARRPLVKRSNKLPLIGGLAAAAAFVLLAGFGISLAFKGEEPVKHTAALVAPTPATVEAPPPKVEPAPVAEAVATADDSSSNADHATDAKPTKAKRGTAAKGKATKGPITSKSPAPASKPVKAADPCGCKGDFNCILACTAGRGKK